MVVNRHNFLMHITSAVLKHLRYAEIQFQLATPSHKTSLKRFFWWGCKTTISYYFCLLCNNTAQRYCLANAIKDKKQITNPLQQGRGKQCARVPDQQHAARTPQEHHREFTRWLCSYQTICCLCSHGQNKSWTL